METTTLNPRQIAPRSRAKINSPQDIAALFAHLDGLDHEELHVATLDGKNRLLSTRMLYQGTASQIPIRVAEVFREAMALNATAIIVAHNHPSGDATPSSGDVSVTEELVKAGDILDISVLDHVVIGHKEHASLRRLGLGFTTKTQVPRTVTLMAESRPSYE